MYLKTEVQILDHEDNIDHAELYKYNLIEAYESRGEVRFEIGSESQALISFDMTKEKALFLAKSLLAIAESI